MNWTPIFKMMLAFLHPKQKVLCQMTLQKQVMNIFLFSAKLIGSAPWPTFKLKFNFCENSIISYQSHENSNHVRNVEMPPKRRLYKCNSSEVEKFIQRSNCETTRGFSFPCNFICCMGEWQCTEFVQNIGPFCHMKMIHLSIENNCFFLKINHLF